MSTVGNEAISSLEYQRFGSKSIGDVSAITADSECMDSDNRFKGRSPDDRSFATREGGACLNVRCQAFACGSKA
jgi:hypothetical protein